MRIHFNQIVPVLVLATAFSAKAVTQTYDETTTSSGTSTMSVPDSTTMHSDQTLVPRMDTNPYPSYNSNPNMDTGITGSTGVNRVDPAPVETPDRLHNNYGPSDFWKSSPSYNYQQNTYPNNNR